MLSMMFTLLTIAKYSFKSEKLKILLFIWCLHARVVVLMRRTRNVLTGASSPGPSTQRLKPGSLWPQQRNRWDLRAASHSECRHVPGTTPLLIPKVEEPKSATTLESPGRTPLGEMKNSSTQTWGRTPALNKRYLSVHSGPNQKCPQTPLSEAAKARPQAIFPPSSGSNQSRP